MSLRALTVRAAVVAVGLGTAAPAASAQGGGEGFLFRRPTATFTLRGGYDRALAGSDYFRDVTDRLTLSRGGFSAPTAGADLAVRLRDRLEVSLGATFARSSQDSEYRRFLGTDDLPLDQRTQFTRLPVTATLKYYLAPRGEQVGRFAWIPARVAPFVAAGGGAVYYRLQQTGWILNEETLVARRADLRSSGWTGAVLGAAGADVSLSPRLLLTTEARYTRARAALDDTFNGFEPLDLSGVALTAGLAVRF